MSKFVIFQLPNKPLIIALLAVAAGWFASGITQTVLHLIFVLAIGYWAYLEITSGVNWFRRLLGGVVALYVLYGLIKPFL